MSRWITWAHDDSPAVPAGPPVVNGCYFIGNNGTYDFYSVFTDSIVPAGGLAFLDSATCEGLSVPWNVPVVHAFTTGQAAYLCEQAQPGSSPASVGNGMNPYDEFA